MYNTHDDDDEMMTMMAMMTMKMMMMMHINPMFNSLLPMQSL
jgi:hypothetical protein